MDQTVLAVLRPETATVQQEKLRTQLTGRMHYDVHHNNGDVADVT